MSLMNKILCVLSVGLIFAASANAEVKKPNIGRDVAAKSAKAVEQPKDANAEAAAEADENADSDEETSKPQAVLFRIENIEPLANKDGLTDHCKYMLTVYNRSDKPIKEANMVLTWTDKVSNKYKVENGEVAVNTGKATLTRINAEVSIDGVAPHKQKSFEQQVKTDKCYLLLDNVSYKVEKCAFENSTGQAAGDCSKIFNYIDSKNPEYYSEFKDVPASVLEKQAEEEKEQELSKINAKIDTMTKTMDETTELLRKIK